MNFKIEFENDSNIPNDFIDKFLTTSNPTYFAVYIYVFQKVYDGITNISYADISMEIEFVTENDVVACFKYYQKKGIITIENELISFLAIKNDEQEVVDLSNKEETDILAKIEIEKRPTYDMREIELYRRNNEDFKNLFILAEKSFGRTLKQSDMFIIFDIYDRLMLPTEVIEYLIEHYTSKGITNMTYMEKVATNWYDKDVKTKSDAMKIVNAKNEDYMRIRKALGMNSKRDKTYAEEKMLDKFYNEYNFSLDIILEGCDAAVMSSKGSPSYNYLEGILFNWYNEGVKTLEDVKKRYVDIKENRKNNINTSNNKKSPKYAKKNKFANFSQKSLNFDEIEKKNWERIAKIARGENVDD